MHFFSDIRTTKSFSPAPYYKVIVEELEEIESPAALGQRVANLSHQHVYWGWKNYQDKSYHFIHPVKEGVEICFPYGSRAEEERGRGKLVRLIIKEIEEMDEIGEVKS